MIDVHHLAKRYGDVIAVDDISFTVGAGHVTGFVGPNGAGKSTTMRMILGLDRSTSGGVLIGGRRYRDLESPLRAIGALLDAGAVDGARTAAHHLLWLADSRRIIADAPTESIVSHHGLRNVYVRADRQADLSLHLVRHGGVIQPAEHGAITVQGLDSATIGAIALAEGIVLTELTPHQPSLEDAFLELTHDVTLHAAALGAPEGA